MQKVVSVPSKVDDLYGLFMDLRKSDFLVKNVGADERGTYVFLEELEEKDPIAKMESWVGKPAPKLTASLRSKRAKEAAEIELLELERRQKREEARLAAVEAERKAMEEAEKSKGSPSVEGIPVTSDLVLPSGDTLLTSPSEEASASSNQAGWFKRIWKKLF